MYKIGDYIVYKRNVCKIKNIDKCTYSLEPLDDNSLTIKVNNSNLFRNVISKIEGEKLINSIPNIDAILVNEKNIEEEYKKLLNTGSLEDLIKIIKTTYLRNYNRVSAHKKIGEKDDNYFKKAEKLLYNELSIGLGMTYEETKSYIIKRVEQILQK